MKPLSIWTAIALLYALFFSWYTSFGGPLRAEEIEGYLAQLTERGAPPERLAIWRAFMESDTGDDFAMLNAIDYRDEPLPVAGVPSGASSAQVMERYTAPFFARALRTAAHPILMGRAASPAVDLWGIEGAEVWDMGGLVRYRSRRDLMEQAIYASTLDIHDFKVAAMEKTIAYPLDPFFHAGDPRLILAFVLVILGLLLQLWSGRRAQAGP